MPTGIGSLTDYADGYGGKYIRANVGDTPMLWHRTDAGGSWGLNPDDKTAGAVLSNNNLTLRTDSVSGGMARASVGVSTGKWYWETVLGSYTNTNSGAQAHAGLSLSSWAFATGFGNGQSVRCGQIAYNGATPAGLLVFGPNGSGGQISNPQVSEGVIIGIAFDSDAGTVAFYANNTLVTTKTGLSSGVWFPTASVVSASSAFGNGGQVTMRFSAAQQSYAPPSGYFPLSP